MGTMCGLELCINSHVLMQKCDLDEDGKCPCSTLISEEVVACCNAPTAAPTVEAPGTGGTIKVKNMFGIEFEPAIDQNGTVERLFALISVRIGKGVAQIRVLYGGKEIKLDQQGQQQ